MMQVDQSLTQEAIALHCKLEKHKNCLCSRALSVNDSLTATAAVIDHNATGSSNTIAQNTEWQRYLRAQAVK